jgi:hypothetical protein
MGLTYKSIACKTCHKEFKIESKKYRQQRSIFRIVFGYCPCCERYFRWRVKTRRRNTAYAKEADNWLTSCKACKEEDYAYFADLWDQYYGSI